MSGIQSKITRHLTQEEDMIHNERNQSMEIDPGLTYTVELQTNILKHMFQIHSMLKNITRGMEVMKRSTLNF